MFKILSTLRTISRQLNEISTILTALKHTYDLHSTLEANDFAQLYKIVKKKEESIQILTDIKNLLESRLNNPFS